MRILILANILGTLGIYLELGGGSWDVATHILRGGKGTDDFWTAPHSVLYAGIGLLGLASLAVLPMTLLRSLRPPGALTLGLRITLVGSLVQVFAGGLDQWWHATHGPDVVLFSPPHATLIVAMAANALGIVLSVARLRAILRFAADGRWTSRWPNLLQVLSLATLWIALNAQAYLFTNIEGIRYTFGVDLSAHRALLILAAALAVAAAGTLVLLLSDRLVGRFAATAVAAATAATLAVTTLAVLPDKWGFIPVYAALPTPVALLDYLGRRATTRPLLALRAVALAPLAFGLDGWLSSELLPAVVRDPAGQATLAVALTSVVGLVALYIARPLGNLLEGRGPRPASTAL